MSFSHSKYKQDFKVYDKLKRPERYCGKIKEIHTRSSWEKFFILNFLDVHPSVIEWSSEDFHIPYRWQVDGRIHRYFPDFYVKVKNKHQEIEELIIEIKPFDQTKPPKTPKRVTKKHKERLAEYVKNTNKWEQAYKYTRLLCEKGRNIRFVVMTENELFPKQDKRNR